MTYPMEPGSSFKTINLDYLLTNLGGNAGAAKRLVSMYLNNQPALLSSLDQGISNTDLRAIKQAVHDIRGSCVLFSANACLVLARRIEDGLRQMAPDTLPGGVLNDDLMADCLSLRQAVVAMGEELRTVLAVELPGAG